MPRRPPQTWKGTCSRCRRQFAHTLLRGVRARGGGPPIYLCPVCFVPTHLKRTAGATAASPAMPEYKPDGAAPNPPAVAVDPPAPLQRVSTVLCEMVGCGKAASYAARDSGRARCMFHHAAGDLPLGAWVPIPRSERGGGG